MFTYLLAMPALRPKKARRCPQRSGAVWKWKWPPWAPVPKSAVTVRGRTAPCFLTDVQLHVYLLTYSTMFTYWTYSNPEDAVACSVVGTLADAAALAGLGTKRETFRPSGVRCLHTIHHTRLLVVTCSPHSHLTNCITDTNLSFTT